MKEDRKDWLMFVARYRDGSLDRFAVDPFTLLRGNYVAGNDARKRQEEGSLKLGEIVLVYRDRRFMLLRKISPSVRREEKEQPMTTIADLPALFHFRRPERAA